MYERRRACEPLDHMPAEPRKVPARHRREASRFRLSMVRTLSASPPLDCEEEQRGDDQLVAATALTIVLLEDDDDSDGAWSESITEGGGELVTVVAVGEKRSREGRGRESVAGRKKEK